MNNSEKLQQSNEHMAQQSSNNNMTTKSSPDYPQDQLKEKD